MNGWRLEPVWAIEMGGALCAFIGLNFLLKRSFRLLGDKPDRKENRWRTHLPLAALFPAQALLWILFLSFSIDLAARNLGLEKTFAWVDWVRNLAVVILAAVFLLRWKQFFFKTAISQKIQGKFSLDPVSLEILGKGYTFVVLFASLLALLQICGLNIVPLITFGGIGAAALGFASRDVVSNFFGGLMVYATRPFTLNDLIELPEKKITGHIEEIGWYRTSVRDLQKKAIYIPNSIFSKEVLLNHSRMTHRRIEESIGIRYDDASKLPSLLGKIRNEFKIHPKVEQNLPVYVFLNSLAPCAFEIELKGYVKTTAYEEFMEVKEQILFEIYRAVQEEGAEIAAPNSWLLLGS